MTAAPDNHVLDADEREAARAVLTRSGWTLAERLSKRFEFADFCDAMAFMTRVGFDAERLRHHPNWTNVYNRVDVELESHDLGGVSALCVALAQAMDEAQG